jgi:hypothetical protein
MEPEGSLPFSQESSTGPHPEPDQSSSYHPILFQIHYNIILPPTLSSSFWLSHKNPICIPLEKCVVMILNYSEWIFLCMHFDC